MLRCETIKILEEIIRAMLHDIALVTECLDMTPRAWGTRVKIDKWNYSKLKDFYTTMETINRSFIQLTTEFKKIFKTIYLTRCQYLKFRRNTFNSIVIKQITLLRNGQRNWIDISSKKTYKWQQIHSKMFNITNHQRNANKVQAYNTLYFLKGLLSRKQKISVSKDVEKLGPLYTVDGNVKWSSCYRKHIELPQKVKK